MIDPAQIHAGPEWKHARPLVACRFDPTGKFAFSGAEDNLAVRWNLETGAPTNLAGHDSWVRSFAFLPDGAACYSGGYDGRILHWPATAEAPEPERVIEAHAGWVRALAMNAEGTQLASCGNDNLVKLWNPADGSLIAEFAGHESHVYNVLFTPDGQGLASCDLKGNVKQWDIAERKVIRDIPVAALHKYDNTFRADIGGARSMAFSRDGKQLALAGITNVSNAFAGIGNPAVVLLNWEEGTPAVQYGSKEKVQGVGWGVAQHEQGFWIGLSGGAAGGLLYFWREAEADEFVKFKLPDSGRDMHLSPDGRRLLVAHTDGMLRTYNLFAKE
jgi:WD40 repeat protein